MQSLQLINNYQADLVKSQNSPLLIELTQKDIKSFGKQLDESVKANLTFLVAQKVYDEKLTNNTTNIIAIDGDSCLQEERFYLLEDLLNQLSLELKDIKNISVLKETLKAGASVATGGLLNQFVGTYLEKGVDYIFDEVGEHFSKLLLDTVTDNINVSAFAISNVEGFLQDTAGDSLGDFIGNASKHQLNLSSSAKIELDTLSKAFSKSDKHDVFQLAFKILLAISLESPKVIYINNPHKLDDNSLAIISLLLSYAKHQKDTDKHLGLSIVFTYTDAAFQPYCEVPDNLKQKQRLLDDQRRFAQRYAMLERPSSDIPKVAIKSSLFVGRGDELKQLQDNFEQRERVTISVISGEPGIGKTALVNKHLAVITENKSITLTLLNEVGHTSSNTGLSCLEKSILDEATRLSLLKTWKEKGVSGLKGLSTTDNAIKVIGAIFSGTDKVLGMAMKGHERLMVDSHINSIKEGGMGDLDCQEASHKEKQFDKLDKAINILLPLSEPSNPVVLFIDDCQWIDDNSCEYILTRLAKKVPLYIVTTIRPSDATTLLKQHLKSRDLHEYSIALLKAIETKGHQEITTAIDTSDLALNTINLSGFDKKSLNELILHVIQGEEAQCNALTDTIFNEISGPNATTINTLFAIETINMLCDKKLYSENKTTRLIVDNPLRFNSEITDVTKVIKKTFVILQNKYQESLSHYEKSGGLGSFNLMAYAVLEERLHLLKLYFTEHGNAAVNTLLFSSLLGAPFSSTIVKSVLEALATSEQPLLASLKKHIKQSEQEVGLTTEHYAIIDEVYEILSRYNLNDDKYRYRHSLLHIFLDKQLDHLLDTLFVESTTQAKEKMFELMLKVINQESELQNFFGKHEQSLSASDYELMLFFSKTELTILKKGFEINEYRWADRYTISLIGLAGSYKKNQQLNDAINLEEEALDLIKSVYKDNPTAWEVWADLYTVCLNNLALSYQKNQQLNDAIKLGEEALDLLKALYKVDPTGWVNGYTRSLINLAEYYKTNQQFGDAIKLQEESFDLIKALYKDNPTVWAKSYTINLNNLAVSYQKNQQLNDAIKLQEESFDLIKVLYKDNPTVWAEDYIRNLNNLALSYQDNQQFSHAIKLQEKSFDLLKVKYKDNPTVWAEYYTISLMSLSGNYKNNQQLNDAIRLEEEALDLIKSLYKDNPTVGAKIYVTNLRNLATSHQNNMQFNDAVKLGEEALDLLKALYKDNPTVWAEDYTASLRSLAGSYKNNQQLNDAIKLEEELLDVAKALYKDNPTIWAKGYIASLISLAASYQKKLQFNDAIKLEEEALNLLKALYKDNPTVWAGGYTRSLTNLAVSYKNIQQLNDAITLSEEAQDLLKALYKSNPTVWAERYIYSMVNLAAIYQCNQQLNDAIKLEEEALDLIKALYKDNPTVWAKDYTGSLSDLSVFYQHNQQFSKYIVVAKESLDLRKSLYKANPTVWVEGYATSLINLAASYQNNHQLNDAIKLGEEALDLLKVLYKDNPTVWAKRYTASLNNLASSYSDNQQLNHAIKLQEEALDLIKALYKENPTVWVEGYTISLNNLAASYQDNQQLNDAIKLQEVLLGLHIALYKDNPTVWAEGYVTNLAYLVSRYQDNQQHNDALKLEEELLDPLNFLYKDNPIVWAQRYATNLNSLAHSYKNNQQHNEALKLEAELLDPLYFLYKDNPTVWAKRYTINLISLASSYKQNQLLTGAIKLETEALRVIDICYHTKPNDWRILRLHILKSLASTFAGVKDFKSAHSLFKAYFDDFSIETIEYVEGIMEFILPFVEYFQGILKLGDRSAIESQTQFAAESAQFFRDKFKNTYQQQIQLVHDGYEILGQSDDEFDRDKYNVFRYLFIK
jgi:tetratricopeptide (TPR) repeat protein